MIVSRQVLKRAHERSLSDGRRRPKLGRYHELKRADGQEERSSCVFLGVGIDLQLEVILGLETETNEIPRQRNPMAGHDIAQRFREVDSQGLAPAGASPATEGTSYDPVGAEVNRERLGRSRTCQPILGMADVLEAGLAGRFVQSRMVWNSALALDGLGEAFDAVQGGRSYSSAQHDVLRDSGM
jgi:hypothetical protein